MARNRTDVAGLHISASIMCGRLGGLAGELRSLERGGVDSIHVDVMDGHFVPNLTFGPDAVQAMSEATTLPLHAHMMVTGPEAYVTRFSAAGVHTFMFHIESARHPNRLIDQIRQAGMVPGIAINPVTPVDFLRDVEVPVVLLMAVEPGFAGQRWLPATERRLEQARSLLATEVLLGVDGNVSLEKVELASRLGARLLVCGTSSLFGSTDYQRAVAEIRRAGAERPERQPGHPDSGDGGGGRRTGAEMGL